MDVPPFVTVAGGERFLNKQVFTRRIAFPPNGDQAQLAAASVEIDLLVTPQHTGAAYTISVGFQFSRAEPAAQGR